MRPTFQAFLLIPLLIVSALRAQPAAIDKDQPWRPPRYMFTYDTDISSRAGADNILGAYYIITGWENRFLPPRWTEENRFLAKLGGNRLPPDQTVVVGLPAPDHISVFFPARGFRPRVPRPGIARYQDIEYLFSAPYSGGGAQTRFRYGSQRLTWDMDIAMAMGGVEANSLLAERLKKDWLQSGSMSYPRRPAASRRRRQSGRIHIRYR